MSRILIISPEPTHPPDAGNRARIRSMTELLRELGHDLYFMHVQDAAGGSAVMAEAWRDRYLPVVRSPGEAWPARARRRARRLGRRLGLHGAYRFGVDGWYDPAVDAAVDAFIGRAHVDAVIVEYVFLSRALLRFGPDVLKVIDTHDVFADRHRRFLAHGQQPAWFSCSAREEAKGLGRADAVLAIQDEEAADLGSRCAAPVVTVGHAVTLRPLPQSAIVPGRLLAVGSDNPINESSLRWFVDEVLPRVRRGHAGAELTVAGGICRRLPGDVEGLRLLGPLEDLAEAYAGAQVVVNPMQFGTGLKIKTLEALGYARALVTTPCGAAGLPVDGHAFRVAPDAAAMADEIVRLLADGDRALALARAGHGFAEACNRTIRATLIDVFGSGSGERSGLSGENVAR